MLRNLMVVLLLVAVASMATVLPASAAAPTTGTVVEGESVPGISLGDSRAQVEAAYGAPQWCQSVEVGGDRGYCSFPVNGGGQVDVRYHGPNGGPAGNSPDDIAYNIRWTELVSGWNTTAGVNTALAAEDPQAVLSAYPQAQVTYNQWGAISKVVDYAMGIEILWSPDFYSGTTHVSMAIFAPTQPPPTQEKLALVTEINLDVIKRKGKRTVRAFVRVQDDQGLSLSGATLSAHWVLPDGSIQTTSSTTSSSGNAYLEISRASRGTYTLVIDNVVKAEYQFDPANSVLNASISIK